MWSLSNLLRLVLATAVVELRSASHPATGEEAIARVDPLRRTVNRYQLASIAIARAAGLEWHELAAAAGCLDVRAFKRSMADDVRRLQREVLFPERAGGGTVCPEWWGLPAGMENPDRLMRDLDRHAALTGGPLVSATMSAPAAGQLDSAVAVLEELRADVAAHRLAVLYGGAGAGDSPLPLGVTESEIVTMLERYRAEADRLSALA